MENIKYKFINLNSVATQTFNRLIPQYLPFNEACSLYQKSKYVCKTDDGWASIVEADNSYYHVALDDGHIYMTEIEILK